MLLFHFASLVGGQAGLGTTIADIHMKNGVITAPEDPSVPDLDIFIDQAENIRPRQYIITYCF